MSYNWKCCSFYPNNFDASALGRGTMTLCALLCSFVLFKTIKWVRQEL